MRLLFNPGPALGHIGRLLSVAQELRKAITGTITFAVPERTKFLQHIIDAGFEAIPIPCRLKTFDFYKYPGALEHLCATRKFDLIVNDANPILWGAVVNWPKGVPRVVVSNVFLTHYKGEETVQARQFRAHKVQINHIRKKKNLEEYASYEQLYHADIVCLADPDVIIKTFGKLNDRFKPCGACFWGFSGKLPNELASIHNHIVVSMGSTGRKEISYDFLSNIRALCAASEIIYVGPSCDDICNFDIVGHCYEMLPLENVLKHASLAITQGGSGSTYQALSYGAPLVIVPNHTNHKILGNLLHESGLAICCDNGHELADIKPSDFVNMQYNAQNCAKKMQTEDGPKTIAKHIQNLLK